MNFIKKIFGAKLNKKQSDRVMYYYLYGIVRANPSYSFKDSELAQKLFSKIIGKKAGIMIGNSLHPYHTIDKDGGSIWDFAFIYNLKNDADFEENFSNKLSLIELSSKFNQIFFWDDDTRLSYEESPVFGKAVPFIIPFIVFDKNRDTDFDKRILKELKENGHAHNYLEEINSILKEFMHESVFAMGFDEFKMEHKNKMIDNFIKVKEMIENNRD